jgi:hypothetical protein
MADWASTVKPSRVTIDRMIVTCHPRDIAQQVLRWGFPYLDRWWLKVTESYAFNAVLWKLLDLFMLSCLRPDKPYRERTADRALVQLDWQIPRRNWKMQRCRSLPTKLLGGVKKILQLPKLHFALQAGLWRKKLLYITNPALRMQNTSSDSKTWKSSRVFWKRTIAFNTERNLQKHWPNGILESIRRKPQFLGTAHHFKGSDGRQYRKSPLGELELKRRTIAPACLVKVQSFSTSTSDGCPSQRTFSFLQTQQLHQPGIYTPPCHFTSKFQAIGS